MYGIVLIGFGVLAVGFGIQRFIIVLQKKQHREVKERFGNYFDTDIFSSEHSIATFIESDYPSFTMSGKQVLWALSDDYQPCAVAYDTSQMIVCKAEVQNGKIHRRDNNAKIIDFTPACVKMIWLLRQTEEKPVFEVDIMYEREGERMELKLIRFSVDVDGGMNYHKFRNFTKALGETCEENRLSIRNLIR